MAVDLEQIAPHLHYVRYSYERLILQQHHIEFNGLWYAGDKNPCYIVCEHLESAPKTTCGKDLIEWFDRECRVMTSWVEIVSLADPSWIRIPERNSEELASLNGVPIRALEFPTYLDMFLPKDFPDLYLVKDTGRHTTIASEIELTDEQKNIVKKVSRNITGIMEVDFVLDTVERKQQRASIAKKPDQVIESDTILSYRTLRKHPQKYSQQLLQKVEEDDDHWTQIRNNFWQQIDFRKEFILPESFQTERKACLLDATGDIKNLRAYLLLYSKVIISLPHFDQTEILLQKMNVSRRELLELTRQGRVLFIAPHRLQFHDQKLLSEIIEVAPSSLLLSRTLAAATIAEIRQRNPFLFPTLGMEDRVKLLNLLSAIDAPYPYFPKDQFVEHIAHTWLDMEADIQLYGARDVVRMGLAPLIASILDNGINVNLLPEFLGYGMGLEWSMALNATYFPLDHVRGAIAPFAEVCAAGYSVNVASNENLVQNRLPDLERILSNVLTISNDANILDITSIFNFSIVEKLHEILANAVANGVDNKNAVEEFTFNLNKEVRKFERKSERLSQLDTFTFLGAVVTLVNPSYAWIPIGQWLLSQVLVKADPDKVPEGQLLDWLRSKIFNVPKEAIFISRLRKNLGKL